MISEQLHRMRAHVWIIHYNCFMKFYNTKPILFHKKLIHSLHQHHSNSRSSHHTLGSSKILALAPLPILVNNELLPRNGSKMAPTLPWWWRRRQLFDLEEHDIIFKLVIAFTIFEAAILTPRVLRVSAADTVSGLDFDKVFLLKWTVF